MASLLIMHMYISSVIRHTVVIKSDSEGMSYVMH